jgi:hypothetical protein
MCELRVSQITISNFVGRATPPSLRFLGPKVNVAEMGSFD